MNSQEYRTLIGQFATGVTVVTTQVDGLLHGMTANAVSSLSLDPFLLLVCIDKEAACHRQLELADWFGVNILAENQQEISNTFAQARSPTPDGFAGIPHRLTEEGVPLLDGCLATMVCKRGDCYEGGDHSIFLGQVTRGSMGREGPPLLFFGGRYREIKPVE